MKSNFDKAVRKAFEEIKYLTDRGVMKYMESFTRSALIGSARETLIGKKNLRMSMKTMRLLINLDDTVLCLLEKIVLFPLHLKSG